MSLSLQAPEQLGWQDRLSIEGSVVFLDQVTHADVGLFEIKDILGFTVAKIHLGVERKYGEGRKTCRITWFISCCIHKSGITTK